jgi:hypothetical protein
MRRIIMLMADPRPADAERLKGYEYSRVTVGEYRIVFDVRDGALRVLAAGKRNDDEVYRRLPWVRPARPPRLIRLRLAPQARVSSAPRLGDK